MLSSVRLGVLPLLLLLCQADSAGILPSAGQNKACFVLPGLRLGEGKPFSVVCTHRGRPCSSCHVNLMSLVRSTASESGYFGEPQKPKRAVQRRGPCRVASAIYAKAISSDKGNGAQEQGGDASHAYFPQLSRFDSVGTLLDAVTPFMEDRKLTGRNAAHVLNKLKAMRRPKARGSEPMGVVNTERERVEEARVRLMCIASDKMDELALKHIALILNAVKGSRGAAEAELVKAACSHAVKLLNEEKATAGEDKAPSVAAQTVAMLLNSLAMGTGGFSATTGASKSSAAAAAAAAAHKRQALSPHDTVNVVDPVFDASTRVLLAMPSDAFDAQSISTIMNAYASAGRWHLPLFRRLGASAIALPPSSFATLQPVAMIVNAYSRLLEQAQVLSP